MTQMEQPPSHSCHRGPQPSGTWAEQGQDQCPSEAHRLNKPDKVQRVLPGHSPQMGPCPDPESHSPHDFSEPLWATVATVLASVGSSFLTDVTSLRGHRYLSVFSKSSAPPFAELPSRVPGPTSVLHAGSLVVIKQRR